MKTEIDDPIQYFHPFENGIVNMNQLLDKKLAIKYIGNQCLNCSGKKKIFRQGFCYNCFYSSPQVGDWIMRPELSKAHLDIEDRDLEYEKKVQLKPHIVYLALSSVVKVGVTRKTQVPTRWIDQGANAALEILEAPNRYIAGITEVALKKYVADKTNWRRMLKNEVTEENLKSVKNNLVNKIPLEAQEYILPDSTEITELNFPVIRYPEKIKSLNLEKTPEYQGRLKGIKGQYLIFEDNIVFNIRSNEGKVITLDV